MDSTLGMLERLANGSSCVYYFLEQLVWWGPRCLPCALPNAELSCKQSSRGHGYHRLCKAGMIKDKDLEWRLGSASVRAEMLSYMANIAASLLKLSALLEHERLLESEFRRREKVPTLPCGSELCELPKGQRRNEKCGRKHGSEIAREVARLIQGIGGTGNRGR